LRKYARGAARAANFGGVFMQQSSQFPWISGGQFTDVDAQAAHLHGYDQQYQQLSEGPFEGRFRSFNFEGDLGVHLEVANRALAQAASTPTGRLSVCLLTAASEACTLNAGHFGLNQVAICPAGLVLEGKTSEGVSLCCMDVAADLLPAQGRGLNGVRVIDDPLRSHQLRDLVDSGLTALTALNAMSHYPAAVKEFKSALGDLLWQIGIQQPERDVKRANGHTSDRTMQIFRRARDYIQDGLADGISIVALCEAVGVSRRALELVFRAVLGTGPGHYVRTLQLNEVRRDLLSNPDSDESIGSIAAQHGIWHWSRFSRDYRAMFGELPSQTRLRTAPRPAQAAITPA
jgi:AraC family transcriptional regulator, ethanolamine operon transcriptional activator